MKKQFRGETLGYVTPWNNKGYDWAKQFRSKFTYISPVWLQLREDSDHVPIITGTHDIDSQWVKDVKYGVGGTGTAARGPCGGASRRLRAQPPQLGRRPCDN